MRIIASSSSLHNGAQSTSTTARATPPPALHGVSPESTPSAIHDEHTIANHTNGAISARHTSGGPPTNPPVSPSLAILLDLCRRYMSSADLALITAAHAVADVAHAGVTRKSGEPYIEHPIAVAIILAELAVDAQGIAAALLHDTVEDTSLTRADVEAQFGPVIAAIVDGVTKFTAVETPDAEPSPTLPLHSDVIIQARSTAAQHTPIGQIDPLAAEATSAQAQRERKARQQSETVRKLFVALLQDPRVVLVKLADRLHNLRTMSAMKPAQREIKARETLDIFAPLAGRIGLYLIKLELEDLAFSYLHPETYARIAARLRDEESRRKHWAQRMCDHMRRELAASGINAAVNWRMKRPYSAWLDTRQNGMDVALLHDVIAFRVITNSTSECYSALGVIHQLWHPHRDASHDYIATPKMNGYQSLHTAVFALDGRLAQMHIRTHDMHLAAQHGVAVYWLQRALSGESAREPAASSSLTLQGAASWVDQIATWHSDLALSAAEFVDTVRGEMFEQQVYVFTPKGDVRELPAGSTILDLAYQIHTRLGDSTVGARIVSSSVGGLLFLRDVPVSYMLQQGDVVRVRTAPDANPSPEWLHIARTRYAQEKIRRSLRMRERAGQAPDTDISARATAPAASEPAPAQQRLRHPSGKLATPQIARCCYPCPEDALAGVVERGRVVTIHRACCRTLQRTLARRKARGAAHSKPLRVTWESIAPMTYYLYLAIYGQDHRGLMFEVSECVTQLGLGVAASAASANQDRHKADITLAVEMPPTMRRDTLLRRLSSVPGVTAVERDTHKGCLES